jgi:hypothetical protein
VTLKISWSGLSRYEACHHHHLRVIEGKAIRRGFASRDFLAGNVADRTMREFLRAPDPKPELPDLVDEWFERFTDPALGEEDFRPVKWRRDPSTDRAEVKEFVLQLVDELRPVLDQWVLPYDYHPELRFEVVIGLPYLDGRTVGVKLIGGIDVVVRISEDPPTFILFDLKATKHDSYIAKTLGQGVFYDVAWAPYWGAGPPKRFGFITPALTEKLIWADIDDDDRRVMRARIEAFAQGMWRGDWSPKVDNAGCEYCDTQHACDKFAVHIVTDSVGKRRASFEDAVKLRREAGIPHPEQGRT